MERKILTIRTKKKREVVDITDEVEDILKKAGEEFSLCHLFLTHTTAALTTADLDPGGTDLDYLEALEKIIPKLKYRHPHNPEHMPEHILSSLIGTSLTLPVEKGELVLGTWQKVILIELDGPRDRQVVVSLCKD